MQGIYESAVIIGGCLFVDAPVAGHIDTTVGTSLIRTPMGQKKVPLLMRCPH